MGHEMNDIILIGGGGHAISCIDVIELSGEFKIAGIIDKDENGLNEKLRYPIIGVDSDLEHLRNNFEYAFVTVGQIKSAKSRKNIFEKLLDIGFKVPVIISPRSYVSKNCQIGSGTIVMHNAVVNSNAEIGQNNIINTRALIEHDVEIGNHTHISTGALINGQVKIGDETFVGSGTITKNNISIGDQAIIGAGSLVKENLKDKVFLRR